MDWFQHYHSFLYTYTDTTYSWMWKISMSYVPEGWGYDFTEEGTNLRQLPWLPWGGDSSPSPCRGEQCGRLSRQPSISFLYGRQSAGCCSRGQDRVSAFSELKKKKMMQKQSALRSATKKSMEWQTTWKKLPHLTGRVETGRCRQGDA